MPHATPSTGGVPRGGSTLAMPGSYSLVSRTGAPVLAVSFNSTSTWEYGSDDLPFKKITGG